MGFFGSLVFIQISTLLPGTPSILCILIIFAILGPFCFYMYFRLSLLINFLQKNPHWDFYLDYIESINQYEENSNPVN